MKDSGDETCPRMAAAAYQVLTAARIRSESDAGTDPSSADRLEAKARERLPADVATVGAGGELAPQDLLKPQTNALRDTVSDPDYVAADASRARLELASRADVLELALDAAATANAGNSLEKMLMHQLAAAHNVAMRLSGRAAEHAERSTVGVSEDRAFHAAAAARAANASARMMETFQRGLLTLQRLRSGGRQVVTVQHVQVNEGGQAVVAGQLRGGGIKRRRKTSRGRSENGG